MKVNVFHVTVMTANVYVATIMSYCLQCYCYKLCFAGARSESEKCWRTRQIIV